MRFRLHMSYRRHLIGRCRINLSTYEKKISLLLWISFLESVWIEKLYTFYVNKEYNLPPKINRIAYNWLDVCQMYSLLLRPSSVVSSVLIGLPKSHGKGCLQWRQGLRQLLSSFRRWIRYSSYEKQVIFMCIVLF